MEHCYLESVGIIPAIADLTMVDDETWELNRINVPMQSRGLGHGTRLLRRVLADADQEGVTLVLYPFPSGALDYKTLVAWYRRNGFDFAGAPDESQMFRRPRVMA